MWRFLRRRARRTERVSPQPPLYAPRVPVGSAFTPSQPRLHASTLIGRQIELARILQALQEDRTHVMLYSERGRGKTSLTNAVVERLRQVGGTVARYSCQADSRFDNIIRGLVRNLPYAPEGAGDLLPAAAVTPDDVIALPSRLDSQGLFCVVDEFDRVIDPGTTAQLADTIKQLSDRGIKLQFMIVGVSENLTQMLGQHASIQRNIAAVQLPLLTDADVGVVIERGARLVGLAVSKELVARCVLLARGSPHFAQLLGLRLVQAANGRGAAACAEIDLAAAIEVLLREASPQDMPLWDGLTRNGQDAEMILVLRRIASAEQDKWGRIFADLNDGEIHLGGRLIESGIWNRILAAGLLREISPGSSLYVFVNRSVMHYILMLATQTLVAGPSELPIRLIANGG